MKGALHRVGPRRSYARDVIVGLLPLLLGLEILATIVYVPAALNGRADFRQFYTGAYLTRTGRSHEMYNFSLQKELEDRLVSTAPGFLSVNHPAIAYLLLSPLSLMTYRHAYATAALVNGLLLVLCFFLLRRYVRDDWLLLASIVGSVAVAYTVWQGQDSILLLLLFILALRSGDEFTSGLYIGLGAFKAQLVLPVLLLYLLWRKWRFAAGFCISSGVLAALSVAMVGMAGSAAYVRSLIQSERLSPDTMCNLRGLVTMAGGGWWFVLAVSIAVLIFCYRATPSLVVATYASLLLGFHTMGHDLVLLLIPIALQKRWAAFLAPALGLIPGYVFLAGAAILADMVHLLRGEMQTSQLTTVPVIHQ